MPRVADWPRAPPEPPCVGHTEGLTPVSDGLVRHGDAALGEEVFDVAETEGEAVVEPDGVADNRRREPVAWIMRHIVRHPATVPQVDNASGAGVIGGPEALTSATLQSMLEMPWAAVGRQWLGRFVFGQRRYGGHGRKPTETTRQRLISRLAQLGTHPVLFRR